MQPENEIPDSVKMEEALKKVFIVVMGLTGAGKSTLIHKATGDPNIVIGDSLDSSKCHPQNSRTVLTSKKQLKK
jgi:ABC-type uncharacterized transport system ATPase component